MPNPSLSPLPPCLPSSLSPQIHKPSRKSPKILPRVPKFELSLSCNFSERLLHRKETDLLIPLESKNLPVSIFFLQLKLDLGFLFLKLEMEYGPSDTYRTDDDLPPSHQNRGTRGGRVLGNGRCAGGALPHPRGQNDMETQIHWLEQEAYSSVLKAFKAQSDAITWEKEGLITELRKELRVSDDEHRELLSRVNADDTIKKIREWRQVGGHQSGLLNNAQPVYDLAPSPTVSASRKRQKAYQSIPSVSLGAPSPLLHTQPVTAPSSSAAMRGASLGSKGKKPKSGQTLTGVTTMKSLQIPFTGAGGKGQVTNRNSSGAAAAYNPLIGRKVWTRWPEDNSFYEAVIADYNELEDRHALVYDINSKNETWEWVNLKEISPEHIRWEGEDPGIPQRSGLGIKMSLGQSGDLPGGGRGSSSLRNQSNKELTPATNGLGKKYANHIEILRTETVIKEVEKVFALNHPDPLDVEKAKKTLREHEQSLIDAIARLAEASDGESGEGNGIQQWKLHGAPYGGEQMVA